MALDVGKGIASVLVARQIDPGTTGPAVAGIAAVLGHIYPVWLGLRGGKGVATTCGVFSILAPQATAIATLVFLALVWWTRYISLGSVAGSVILAPLAYHVRRAGGHGHRRDDRRRHHRASASIESAARVCGHRTEARTKRMKNVAVLGSGSWGTALAFHLASAGHDVRLVGQKRRSHRRDESAARQRGVPARYRPAAAASCRPPRSKRRSSARTLCSPRCRRTARATVIRAAAPFISRQALIVSATKGIEQDTLLRVSEVIAQEVRGARPVAVLSGPSFAIEVARGLPTAVSVACADPVLAEDVQREFRAAYFQALRQHRRRRRRDRRRPEEHHRHRRRRRRRARPRTERARRADHARPRGNHAAGVRRRRPPRDARRIERARRPRADVHRFAQPQSARRSRAGARPADFRSGRRHEDGGRRREDDHGRAGARPQTWRRAADRRRRWRKCSPAIAAPLRPSRS